MQVQDPDLAEVRGSVALSLQLAGHKRSEIAAILGISTERVKDILSEAKRSEIFERARDYVGTEFLPKVLYGMSQLLDQGDKDTIHLLFEKMALAGTGGAKHLAPWGAPAAPAADAATEETFEAFRLKVIRRKEPGPLEAAAAPGVEIRTLPPAGGDAQGASGAGAETDTRSVAGEVLPGE